jgi:hypothetical protein
VVGIQRGIDRRRLVEELFARSEPGGKGEEICDPLRLTPL